MLVYPLLFRILKLLKVLPNPLNILVDMIKHIQMMIKLDDYSIEYKHIIELDY